jgi:hypothetical protein
MGSVAGVSIGESYRARVAIFPFSVSERTILVPPSTSINSELFLFLGRWCGVIAELKLINSIEKMRWQAVFASTRAFDPGTPLITQHFNLY